MALAAARGQLDCRFSTLEIQFNQNIPKCFFSLTDNTMKIIAGIPETRFIFKVRVSTSLTPRSIAAYKCIKA